MELEAVAWLRRVAGNGGARAIRERAGISASEIARELNVSPSTVSRWERGERIPRPDVAERWARLLHVLAAS
jgi:transcriptional regulator with XRE-family HTH domain